MSTDIQRKQQGAIQVLLPNQYLLVLRKEDKNISDLSAN